MSEVTRDVLIIGGGIAGLAAAYRLQRLSPDIDITLVEQSAQLGGKIVTERPGGWVLEGGPDCFLSRKPRGIALVEELGLTGALQGRVPENRRTFVKRHGTLHMLPEGLSGMVPTNLEALEQSTLISAAGRARLAREATLPPAPEGEDESVAHFVRRRLGDEVWENLVEPLMGGIYAGDAEQLSLAATFPQLRRLELEHGSLLRGLLHNAPPADGARYPPFLSFESGMGTLVEALLARLRAELRLGQAVVRVEPVGEGFHVTLDSGERIAARALIVATPAFVTAELLAWDAALAAAHRAIPYASSVLVSLAFRADALPALHGYGYVIPRAEQPEVMACTWTSSKWHGRAPEGHALLRLYLGRYGERDMTRLPDETLLRLARAELADTLDIRAEPLFHRIARWPRGMPQYTLGHPARLATIAARAAERPGLFLAGAAYRGVGIPDCIASGEAAARGVASYLGTSGT